MNVTQTQIPALMDPISQNRPVSGGILEEGRATITPAIAEQLLSHFNYSNQRRISRQHVAKLASEMHSGNWTPGTQIAFGVMPDQRVFLVNGQHRLAAIVQSGETIEIQILLVPCENEDAIQKLYYRFDTVQRTRGVASIIGSAGIAEKLGIPRAVARGAYRAGVIIEMGLKFIPGVLRPPHLGTPDGQLAAIGAWWGQVQDYAKVIGKSDVPTVRRKVCDGSIMAVALVTLKYQPTKALEFWAGVASNDGLRVGDPRRTLHNALATRIITGAEGGTMVLCAHAWNHWFSGKDALTLKIMEASTCNPAGTPFANRKK